MEASAAYAPAGLRRLPLPVPLLRLRSDEQLLALFRAGNDDAFGAIHDRYRQRLFAYVRQMLGAGPRHDAEDVLQDVFVRAFGALRADRRAVNVRAWLFRVAHNRCVDHLRRPVPAPAEVFELSRKPLYDPLEEAQRREDLARLVEDVGRLPEQQRSALLMREIDGMSYADLAGALDVTVPAVKSLLVRARVGLVEAAEARDADCAEIRADLMGSCDRGVKASARARRHMRTCEACAEYRAALRGMRRSFAALSPVAVAPLAVALAKLLGFGAAGGGATAGGGAATAGGSAAAGGGALTAGGTAAAGGGGGGGALAAGGTAAAAAGGTAAAAAGGTAAAAGGTAAAAGGTAAAGGGVLAAGGGTAAAGGGVLAAGGAAAAGGSAAAGGGALAAGGVAAVSAAKVAAVVCTAALTAGGAAVEVGHLARRHHERPVPAVAKPAAQPRPAPTTGGAAAAPASPRQAAAAAPVHTERPRREARVRPAAAEPAAEKPPAAAPSVLAVPAEEPPAIESEVDASGGVEAPPPAAVEEPPAEPVEPLPGDAPTEPPEDTAEPPAEPVPPLATEADGGAQAPPPADTPPPADR